ncbi:MAG: diguanylate cyclase [Thermomicrobiales bacterium]|nr:diguanylate cyclase [Thermomicrobiales bacterium]
MDSREPDSIIAVSNDPDWHVALEAAALAVGLSMRSATPDTLPEVSPGVPTVVALDSRLIEDPAALAEWRARFAATAALVVVNDRPLDRDALARLSACDDLAAITAPINLERALTRARRLTAERIVRANAGPEARSRLRANLTERMTDVIFQLSHDLHFTYVNPAWKAHLGHEVSETIGRSILDFILPDLRDVIGAAFRQTVRGSETGLSTEVAMLPADGPPVWMELRAMIDPRAADRGEITGLMLDISARRETDAELRASHERYRQLALRDPLTGLSNRLVFADRLQHALEVGERRGSGLALLFIDLDNFKPVNDTYGHSIGDRVLGIVASRLSEHIRAGDTIARYGGDEFAVILEDLNDPTQALHIAERLIESLSEPIKVGLEEITVGISVGITLLSGRTVTFEEAIGEADVALYQAKQAGRSQFSFYESSLEPGKTSVYRFDLRRGMANQQLRIVYLPIFDLQRGTIYGIEARVRWDHPTWGMLKPSQFLRRVDASELMSELAREALALVANDIADWRAGGLDVPQIRVAMAVWQVIDSDLVGLFTAAREELGLPGEQFAIELMDGSTAAERDAVQPALEALRGLGLGVGFDNFITGGTPLGGVVEMNPDYVNLYARGHALADFGWNSDLVAEATRALCDAFGWKLVAKDIDTPAMLEWLRELPIRYAQGEALAPGVDADGMLTQLRSPESALKG